MAERDWKKCFLCQKDTHADLRHPANDLRQITNLEKTYTNTVDNVLELQELNALPCDIVILTDYSGGTKQLVKIMLTKNVGWHKDCKSNVNNQKVLRAKNKRKKIADQDPLAKRLRSSSSNVSLSEEEDYENRIDLVPCFLCGLKEGKKKKCKASTLGLDSRVRACAITIGDEDLLAKLSAGDVIAQDFEYHLTCLVKLYRQAATVEKEDNDSKYQLRVTKAYAFSEIIDYIDSQRGSVAVLSMGELYDLYVSRLTSLGLSSINVHRTRFRQDILAVVPDLVEVKDKKTGYYTLVFDEDLSTAIAEYKANTTEEMLILFKASKILRKEAFDFKQVFRGSFNNSSEINSVGPKMLSFMQMTLDGAGIHRYMNRSQQDKGSRNNVPVVLGQLVSYNMVKRRSTNPTAIPRHIHERETPVAIYNAAKVYLNTGQEELVNVLHREGLCISIDRLRTISTDLSNSVIEFWNQIGVVIPHTMKRGKFTTGALDNFDHNLTSTTAKSTFHGTGPSLTQHDASDDTVPSVCTEIFNQSVIGKRKVSSLPAHYVNLPEISLSKAEATHVPKLSIDCPLVSDSPSLEELLVDQYTWLEHAHQNLNEWISWAAYHATISSALTSANAISQMLPLFAESSNNPAMIYHGMNIIKAATEYLNPGQKPVMVVDQPLYTISKRIQWKFPDTHGEEVFLVMLGGLHIEKMLYQVLGDWLDGSGWTSVLASAGVAGSGTAQSFLSAAHITRTRYVHQVTAMSLYTLAKRAYDKVMASCENESSFEEWLANQCQLQPQTYFWKTTLDLELSVLEYVKATRTGNFKLYIDILDRLMPWVFATDHTHYARNLPVHLRDMCTLEERHPELYDEFCKGHFVVQKSRRPFSKIALDQNHEQLNDDLKNCGGVIGNTQSPATMRFKQIAGPELSRLIQEFEDTSEPDKSTHHEQYPKFQEAFKTDVLLLADEFEQVGNPFLEDSGHLLDLETSIIMPDDVVENIRNAAQHGKEKYKKFIDMRITSQSDAFTATLPLSKLKLFSERSSSAIKSLEVKKMKEEQQVTTRIHKAIQAGRDVSEVFAHESSNYPPSITKNGEMYHGTKSEIVSCLPVPVHSGQRLTTAVVLDGAVVVQMKRPGTSVTFEEYTNNIFLPYVLSWFETHIRVDVVWDVYKKDSLKADVRRKRGAGIRRRVTPSTKIPNNWAGFLRVDENKEELFVYLAEMMRNTTIPQGKHLVSTMKSCAFINPPASLDSISPCNQEEADSRILLHVAAAAQEGYPRVLIRTNDSDVIVIATSLYKQIQGLKELWVAYGTGSNVQYLAIHDIAHLLGVKAPLLGAFHSLTGSDTTSSFFGKGKKSAWKIWQDYPELTSALKIMSKPNLQVDDVLQVMPLIEKFTVLLYGVTDKGISSVNEARAHLFDKGRDFENLPPCGDTLQLHVLRSSYQSGAVWGNSLNKIVNLPSPASWGWYQEGSLWKPRYTTNEIISCNLPQLVSCTCKVRCRPPCKCCIRNIKCSTLCECKGECYRPNL